jgi:hypothetical protein
MSLGHLAGRFFGSLDPRPVPAIDNAWALECLVPGERDLWERMPRADRRHSIGVARAVLELLGADATGPVVAAALLHDVGKIQSGLGTYGRVIATVAGAVGGRDTARSWQNRRGFTRRVGLYLRHDTLGAELLAIAGSDPLTVAWASEHHRDRADWTVAGPIADALKAADND